MIEQHPTTLQKQHVLQRLLFFTFALFLAVGMFALPASATGVYQMPQVSAGDSTWVIDEADVISRINEGKLSRTFQNLANNSGNEVRMVVIRRLDFGETIDSFADELFDTWFPTDEAKANQTLLILDTLTNNSAIRTGEATNAILSDETAQSIVEDNIGIPVREGNKYNEAFLSASNRLGEILSGQPDPGAPVARDTLDVESTFTKAEETDTANSTIWVIGLLIAATVIPMLTYFFYVGFPGR
ncbi:TPM domain-containing protein [Lusitaniella coriacea LEGE 07157]|uniref:TPM domain-containing protein n=1 Tax=Lusitaniella coriacea LEGE 07157 TaxID=945747 RepID=A0A8J7DV69_9CYAN|nr:TPM domain-containing protein [Lusitaniella coriacea]MBE9115602.1 TPM domain-containing protein [Lusitaniella coriacea LEGE 07157]